VTKKLKAKQAQPEQTKAPEQRDRAEQILEWAQKHRRPILGTAAAAVVIAIGVWFTIEYQRRKDAAAEQALNQARVAAQSGNLPLAASDLSRLIGSYGGTAAADQATIILARVRLAQGQAALAAEELRAALGSRLGNQFRASAYGLLGTALEEVGNLTEAGEAFEQAADAAWYAFLKAQYLTEAGRAFWAANDTTRAIAAYERVVRDFEGAPSATEARVRLGELRGAPGAARG
jgi:predicted negative regulator of RcsB-dependent stress response